jgi:YidC/Oxa1 family membrane protein insertase
MNNLRVLLWGLLLMVLFWNYQMWQHDYPSTPEVTAPTAVAPNASPSAPAAGSIFDSLPDAGKPASAPPAAAAPAQPAAPAADASVTETTNSALIRVTTDVLDLVISTRGGEIRQASLLKYPVHKDAPGDLVRLFDADNSAAPAEFQWGLTAGGVGPEPNQRAVFSAAADRYPLLDGQAQLTVPLTWTDGAGRTVTRTFTLKRGSYSIALSDHVVNGAAEPWRLRGYAQIVEHWQKPERSMFDPSTYAFKGPVVYNGRKLQKLDVDKIDPDQLPKQPVSGGWAAALQHHFVVAIVPAAEVASDYALKVDNSTFQLGVVSPWRDVAAGQAADFAQTLFVGPKLQDQLSAVGPKLELTADYGRLTIIAQPLFGLLAFVHRYVGNWGFTIIFVTILIKLVFYPLAQASGRSIAKTRAIAPRMKALQERYKDNREELGRQMMELYKREKVNPLAGCLPTLLQMPVFIAFYWVLLESVEMRHAPFLFWLQDMSSRDPYFVLPVILGITMYGQYKMNPAPPDPMQAKVFAFMPLVMTVTMAALPQGLVLYWITNTGLSILQQWRINQVVEAEAKKSRS